MRKETPTTQVREKARELSEEYRVCSNCGSGAVDVIISTVGKKVVAFHHGQRLQTQKSAQWYTIEVSCSTCKSSEMLEHENL